MIADWLTAFGTIGLGFIAAFQDKIRRKIMRPKLEVVFDTRDCHKTKLKGKRADGIVYEADCYYFRLRVKNSGNEAARQVEVYVAELWKKADGTYQKVHSFLPMNLVWSHVKVPYLVAISPGMEKFCDLGHIIDPGRRTHFNAEYSDALGISANKTIFSLDLEVKPFTMSHLIPPGAYHLLLKIAAANAQPVTKKLELEVTGNWHADEAKMHDGEIARMKLV